MPTSNFQFLFTQAQVFYKVIFTIISFLGIGTLFLSERGTPIPFSVDSVITVIGISSVFIFIGFFSMFVIMTIKSWRTKRGERQINGNGVGLFLYAKHLASQDGSIILAFLIAYLIVIVPRLNYLVGV